MTKIAPTVGRVVHYFPHLNDAVAKSHDGQPHVAIIAHVWNEGMVNLAAFDSNGAPYYRCSVELVQPGEQPSDAGSGGYACWMPYQVQQAGIAPILAAVAAEAAPHFAAQAAGEDDDEDAGSEPIILSESVIASVEVVAAQADANAAVDAAVEAVAASTDAPAAE